VGRGFLTGEGKAKTERPRLKKNLCRGRENQKGWAEVPRAKKGGLPKKEGRQKVTVIWGGGTGMGWERRRGDAEALDRGKKSAEKIRKEARAIKWYRLATKK